MAYNALRGLYELPFSFHMVWNKTVAPPWDWTVILIPWTTYAAKPKHWIYDRNGLVSLQFVRTFYLLFDTVRTICFFCINLPCLLWTMYNFSLLTINLSWFHREHMCVTWHNIHQFKVIWQQMEHQDLDKTKRRNEANLRERKRMRYLNDCFDDLREVSLDRLYCFLVTINIMTTSTRTSDTHILLLTVKLSFYWALLPANSCSSWNREHAHVCFSRTCGKLRPNAGYVC